MVACIIFEDRLDSISNYLQWKLRMSVVLKEKKIWNYVNYVVVAPTEDLVSLDLHEVKEAKSQRIILDGVKDNLIPHLVEKKTTQEMWDALKNLFEAKNKNQKMVLKDNMHDTNMGKGESVSSYLTRLAQVKYELVVVGEFISDSELVRIAIERIHQGMGSLHEVCGGSCASSILEKNVGGFHSGGDPGGIS
jgi:hypothetical protein